MSKLWITGTIKAADADHFQSWLDTGRGALMEVFIDSDGGDGIAAMKMAEALHDYKGPTEATLCKAFSAALFPGLTADRVVAARDARALLHPARINGESTIDGMQALVDYARQVDAYLSRILEAKTGHPDSFWRMMWSDGDRYLTAEQMRDWHVVDEISPLPTSYIKAQNTVARNRSVGIAASTGGRLARGVWPRGSGIF